MKTTKLILGLALVLMTFSCSKEDNGSPMTKEEATVNAKIDVMNDDISNIVEEQEANTYADATSGRTADADSPSSLTADCAYITRVPAFGTAPTVGQTVTKTIDFSHFSAEGCTLANGNVLKGVITITFVYQPEATSHTITYAFTNFYHNAIKFDGTKTFTRTLVAATATTLAHPIVVMNMDMTATFPNGTIYNRVGQRVREIIEGIGTPTLGDNIYQITGSWTTTFPSGTQSSTITTPLHVKISCAAVNKPLIVSGAIEIVRNGNTGTLDYGTGECDNTATFTINGNTYTIVIGN